jgi:stalled ribosome alternative rescue factor ArfA
MKKTRKSKILDKKRIKNPVAKFAFQFNKVHIFKDKSKYQRKAKHKRTEPFPMMIKNIIGKGSFPLNGFCQRIYVTLSICTGGLDI